MVSFDVDRASTVHSTHQIFVFLCVVYGVVQFGMQRENMRLVSV